ncbi:MAG: D-alanine--D-alanine ligase [SAR202 cluster bacterium]|nr:D-alanine--D-alanine ligase [SAR202 cluster bacterium]
MKIGLTYDLKTSIQLRPGGADDEAEEYDPPGTIDALASAVERLGHQAVRLGGGTEFLDKVRINPVDLVLNIAEGRGTYRSREAQIPSVLEMLGIPYSGSDPLTLAVALDKPAAKIMVQSAGVSTPAWVVIQSPEQLPSIARSGLRFPMLVKPSYEGSSKGIRQTSRVANDAELRNAVRQVTSLYRQPALVEEFISGAEVTVGVLGNQPPRVLAVMEVVPRQGRHPDFMYSLEVKRDWEALVRYQSPPELPAACIKDIEDATIAAYQALGCRDLARLDFRIDANHRPYFLEANPLPGMGVYSDMPILAALAGMSYQQLVEQILDAAIQRCGLAQTQHAHHHRL